MPIRMRKAMNMGPIKLNFTQDGFSSWSFKLGRWSWNSRTRAHRVDMPGPLHWTSKGKAS